jgi:DNA-3-methyladenine glycosylase
MRVHSGVDRDFYTTDPVTLARALLGKRLVRVLDGDRLSGRIVEAEAYLGPPDLAAHSRGGHRSARNDSMYQRPGTAYVYFTYGMHYCFNVVCGPRDDPGSPVAVLIRALEPVEGIERMREHRAKAPREIDLCSGPAKLCQALAIDRAFDGADLVESAALFVEDDGSRPIGDSDILAARRIGVGYAGAWAQKELRFLVRGSDHVSRPP